MVIDQHGVVHVGPGLQVAFTIEETQPGVGIAPSRLAVFQRLKRPDRLKEFAFVGRAGGDAATAIDKQRTRIPMAFFHSSDGRRPQRPVTHSLPASDGHTTAEHHLFARLGGVGNRGLGRTTVLRAEDQRFAQLVVPAAQDNTHWPVEFAVGLQLAHRVARGRDSPQRPVSLAGIGLGQRATECVITTGTDVDIFTGVFRAASERHGENRQQRNHKESSAQHGKAPWGRWGGRIFVGNRFADERDRLWWCVPQPFSGPRTTLSRFPAKRHDWHSRSCRLCCRVGTPDLSDTSRCVDDTVHE